MCGLWLLLCVASPRSPIFAGSCAARRVPRVCVRPGRPVVPPASICMHVCPCRPLHVCRDAMDCHQIAPACAYVLGYTAAACGFGRCDCRCGWCSCALIAVHGHGVPCFCGCTHTSCAMHLYCIFSHWMGCRHSSCWPLGHFCRRYRCELSALCRRPGPNPA